MHFWYGGIACCWQLVSRHYQFLIKLIEELLTLWPPAFWSDPFPVRSTARIRLVRWNPMFLRTRFNRSWLDSDSGQLLRLLSMVTFLSEMRTKVSFPQCLSRNPQGCVWAFWTHGWVDLIYGRKVAAFREGFVFSESEQFPFSFTKLKDLRDKQEKYLTSDFVFLEAYILNFSPHWSKWNA